MLRAENAERRRAEAELAEHRDHLEEVVADRTSELREEIADRLRAEDALRQRTQELETRNEELDAFAHTVAHDLKNPLTALVGFGELLESRYNTLSVERIRSTLGIIAQNGRKMTNIINELLLLATVRKAGDVDMAPIDMARVVTDAQKRSADLARKYDTNIVAPDVWPAAWGYGPWVEEVWANYISNAIKYGGRPPNIELGATELTETDTICFWVRDNGNGLTPEEQARLFKPFTRLDQVQVKGHGLGLSIVRRIVEKLNGEVCVISEVGQGSTFSFTLPRNSPLSKHN
jgi:signal transduction histidine kinase